MQVPLDNADAVDEVGLEQHVCVVEHAVLQRHHHELRLVEVRAQHLSNVLQAQSITFTRSRRKMRLPYLGV